MSWPEWLQVGALVGLVLVSTPLLGAYLADVYGEGTCAGRPRLRSGRARVYRVFGVDPEREQRWTVYAVSLLAFSVVSVLVLYRAPAGPGRAAAQPDRRRRPCRRARVQHRGQLRHQHELAELRRRVDDEPPHPDGRAGGAELRLGRGRHRRRDRADPRARPAARRPRSATSGSTSRGRSRASCCRSRSSSRSCCVSQGVVQNLHGPADGDHASSGATQTISGGPVASQEAIKELGTNGGGSSTPTRRTRSRTRTAFTNFLEIWALLADPVRAHVHLRQAGEGPDARAGWCSRRCSSSGSARPLVAMAFEAGGNPS